MSLKTWAITTVSEPCRLVEKPLNRSLRYPYPSFNQRTADPVEERRSHPLLQIVTVVLRFPRFQGSMQRGSR